MSVERNNIMHFFINKRFVALSIFVTIVLLPDHYKILYIMNFKHVTFILSGDKAYIHI